MSDKIRIGVLGCSSIAERFVIPAICALPKMFELVAVSSRSEAKLDAYCERLNVRGVLGYQQLIDSSDLDAIYIPLPNSLHFEWVERALTNGLHVLVEKSLACTLEEVQYLNSLADKFKLVLLENFQFQKHKQFEIIKDILAAGRIGELRLVRSSFGFPPFADRDNIRYSRELGGGALLDAGAYPIKIAQEFLGHNLSVSAANLYVGSDLKVDLWGSIQISSSDHSVTGQLSFGFDNYYQCNLELWGSKGFLKANRIFTTPPGVNAVLELQCSDGTSEKINIPADNHFENMLGYFYKLTKNEVLRKQEYFKNINQSRLIAEALSISK